MHPPKPQTTGIHLLTTDLLTKKISPDKKCRSLIHGDQKEVNRFYTIVLDSIITCWLQESQEKYQQKSKKLLLLSVGTINFFFTTSQKRSLVNYACWNIFCVIRPSKYLIQK